MAVIYMPPNADNFGGALGAGVGQGVSTFMEHQLRMQEQQQLMARQMQAFNAVRNAKSREEALGVLTTPGAVNNPQELANALRVIDAMHPPKDETPQMVTGYDPQGGKHEAFTKKGDLTSLNNPQGRAQLFGRSDISFDQPTNLVDMFSDDPSHKELGKFPLSQRPAGAMTKGEFDIGEKIKTDTHRQLTEEKGLKQLELQTQAGQRAAAAADRANEGLDITKQRTAAKMLQDAIDVKKVVGANGELTLDWSGDEGAKKMKAYHEALGDLDGALQRNKGNVAKAVSDLQKKYFPDEAKPAERPKVEPAPAPSKTKKILNDIGAKFAKKPKEQLEKKEGAYVVKSDADYDKLDPGDPFIGPDGKRRTKPRA